jgi:hypothetical protein
VESYWFNKHHRERVHSLLRRYRKGVDSLLRHRGDRVNWLLNRHRDAVDRLIKHHTEKHKTS